MKFAAAFSTLLILATSIGNAASLTCAITDAHTKQALITKASIPLQGDLPATLVGVLGETVFKVSVEGKQVELTAVAGRMPNYSSISSSSKKKANLAAYAGQTLVKFECAITK